MISATGIVVPFALGAAVAVLLHGAYAGPDGTDQVARVDVVEAAPGHEHRHSERGDRDTRSHASAAPLRGGPTRHHENGH